ncbi:MAG: isoprenyl transferase [Hyphomicrobiaceae bacterium]
MLDDHNVASPRHIAIIMDGNGRWAQERGLPRSIGHRMGVDAVRRTIRAAIDLDVTYLTLYSFSTENWRRPADEVGDLMGLMKRFIRRDLAELRESGVRVHVIGSRSGVDKELLAMIDEAVELTHSNDRLNLIIAFNYGARDELASAARRLAERVLAGEIATDQIDTQAIAAELDTSEIPDPDLVIRTSGEERLSNFLLWQCAYSELVFLDDYWPDFGEQQLRIAITRYRNRDRRFGGLRQRSTA